MPLVYFWFTTVLSFEILDSEIKQNSDNNQTFYRHIDEAFFD